LVTRTAAPPPDAPQAHEPPPPLPWLAEPLARLLASQRGHATLLQAAAGNGALEFGLRWAQASRCEGATGGQRPCGHCGSCKLVQSRLHPDLFVLLPEEQRRAHGWLLSADKPEGDDAKRKPSRQIRIDDVRALIDWSQKTSARGRGKAALLHPADTMNMQAASALLKTLEEPPQGTVLLLTAADPDWLLPTVRSRCQHVVLPPPQPAAAGAWLAAQGVAQPEVLLAACNGRPLDALALAQAGVTAEAWAALPRSVAQGHAAAMAGWPTPLMLDALQKLCHDAMARAVGGAPAYFPPASVPAGAALQALVDWNAELQRVARHADHPWSDGLLLESLVGQGRQALAGTVGRHGRHGAPLDTLAG
jgi:DNA polymerase-3 subunit delta'